MNFRRAKIGDSAALARVQVDSYRNAYSSILPQAYLDHFSYEEQEQDWRDLLASPTKDILVVAETEDSEIAGYALGRPEADITPYDSELVALHLRKSYQRKGIGRSLILAVARELKNQGCTSMMVWVLAENTARGLYEHLGGKLIGEKSQSFGDGDVNAVEVAYGWSDISKLCIDSTS